MNGPPTSRRRSYGGFQARGWPTPPTFPSFRWSRSILPHLLFASHVSGSQAPLPSAPLPVTQSGLGPAPRSWCKRDEAWSCRWQEPPGSGPGGCFICYPPGAPASLGSCSIYCGRSHFSSVVFTPHGQWETRSPQEKALQVVLTWVGGGELRRAGHVPDPWWNVCLWESREEKGVSRAAAPASLCSRWELSSLCCRKAFAQRASLSVRSSRAQMLLKAGTLCGFVLTRVLRGAGLQSHICHRLKTQESAVFKSWKGTCQPRALMIFKICLVVPGRCSFIHVH